LTYIGHTREEGERMLAEVGVSSFEELAAQIPERLRVRGSLAVAPALTEDELRRHFRAFERANYAPADTPSFLGGGIYDHAIPALIDTLISRPEFMTAYTPYQPEVSQGTLAGIFEFQTMICELTGMDVANASMYEGASAAAEAVLLAASVTRGTRALIAETVNPRVREVIATYLEGTGITLETLPAPAGTIPTETLAHSVSHGDPVAGLLVQQPNFFGLLEPLDRLSAALPGEGPRRPHLVVSADPLSLGLLAAPGDLGAETVVGDVQPLGVSAQFGGPTAGYFATRARWIRRLPGRLVAEAHDAAGRRGFTLTLQTREQHIRREKATSNICTNSALVALRATIYLALVGPQGLRDAATQCLARSRYAEARLTALRGVTRVHSGPFFREFVVRLTRPAEEVVERVYAQTGILAGIPLARFASLRERPRDLLVAVTERRTREEIEALAIAVERALI
jgi:glycine dehydrogenase subunit 1